MKSEKKKLTSNAGAPVADNQNVMTAGPRGPMLLQDVWFLEKMAHFDREVIPERRMHAKGSGAYGAFTVTHDITQYTKAKHQNPHRHAQWHWLNTTKALISQPALDPIILNQCTR